jgi:cyclopropane-fatty-acyl-phospholipid synthase
MSGCGSGCRRTRSGRRRRNIAYHYDLGNDFYRLWLDETMTYSSAIFDNPQESLETAQRRKYASMVDQMGARAGDHVLEIGCGWGGFAEYAAKERGLRVTGLTISQAQHDLPWTGSRRRAVGPGRDQAAGLSRRAGSYDGIASIEMFEAVGERYWPVYFNSPARPAETGAQRDLADHHHGRQPLAAVPPGVDFIQKYIFPGGMLPAPSVLRAEVERAGLQVNWARSSSAKATA